MKREIVICEALAPLSRRNSRRVVSSNQFGDSRYVAGIWDGRIRIDAEEERVHTTRARDAFNRRSHPGIDPRMQISTAWKMGSGDSYKEIHFWIVLLAVMEIDSVTHAFNSQ